MRFGTLPVNNQKNANIFVSGKIDFGYQWFNTGFTLFGGINYLISESEKTNQYVEEWANSGFYEVTYYTEKRSLRFISFEIGILLNFDLMK